MDNQGCATTNGRDSHLTCLNILDFNSIYITFDHFYWFWKLKTENFRVMDHSRRKMKFQKQKIFTKSTNRKFKNTDDFIPSSSLMGKDLTVLMEITEIFSNHPNTYKS